jgi:hypothetical protein
MLRTAATSLLIAPFLLSDDAPRLGYDAGAEVTRTWSIRTVRTVEDATMTMNENPQDIGSGSVSTSTVDVAIVDRVAAVDSGAPTRFSRTYESIDTASKMEGIEESEGMQFRMDEGSSELAGLSVDFAWDADQEEWSRDWSEESDGDDDWLEDLAADMDLRAILPGEEPSVGDSWDVPVGALADLLAPGGTLEVFDDGGGDDVPEGGIAIMIPSASDVGRWDELEGDVRATFEGIVEEDGPRVAKIVLEVDVEGEVDLVEDLEDEAAERGADEEYTEAVLTRTLEGRIVVEWDLAQGRFAAVEGTLEGSSEFYASWTIAFQGLDLGIEVERAETSETTISASQS